MNFLKTILLFFILFFASQIYLSCTNKTLSSNDDKVLLGRYLFFDRRLSENETKSCSSCHDPKFSFTDGYKRSLGIYADVHLRNAQPLINLSYLKYLTAADTSLQSVVEQMNNPFFNEHPVEMGLKNNEQKIINRIKKDKLYVALFAKINQSLTVENIKNAIASFILSIKSNNSPYDKFIKGDTNALTQNQKMGKQLFFSAQLNCSQCHGGFNFATPTITNGKGDTIFYFNTGLYNLNGNYPSYDQGLYNYSKNENDKGMFRVPTLRNLAFTAPYLHDGSAATLMEVIDSYANGGRNIKEGINKGDGSKNPLKHPLIKGFTASESDKKCLIDFLLSLSDSSILINPSYANPFTEDETKKN